MIDCTYPWLCMLIVELDTNNDIIHCENIAVLFTKISPGAISVTMISSTGHL